MGSNQKGLSRIPQSPVEYADLIELSIIAQPRSTFSIDKIRELFPEYLHVDDIVIGIAVEEMRRRSALLGSKYPFNVTNARILPDESSSIYVYLLATSFRSFIRGSSADQEESISKRFEELSEFCLCSFFGGSSGLQFEWESNLDERIAALDDKMAESISLCGEILKMANPEFLSSWFKQRSSRISCRNRGTSIFVFGQAGCQWMRTLLWV
jgi:hypothetical protein